jgi:hypothetical protein
VRCIPTSDVVSDFGAMTRLTIFVVIAAQLSLVAQTIGRSIPYDPNAPITARLLPDDSIVIVRKAMTTPFRSSSQARESFEQEIQRLAPYETIATIVVSSSQGEFVDRGTWLRTRVDGRTLDMFKGGALFTPAGFVQFWHDGGKTQVGKVAVTAGVFPEFQESRRYLVFLRMDENRNHPYAALAFHITETGLLERIRNSDGGGAWPLPSNLLGRPIADVAAAFAKAR